MRTRKVWPSVVAAVAALATGVLGAASPAVGRCVDTRFPAAADRADSVFVGEVTKVTPGHRSYYVRVKEVYKGSPDADVFVKAESFYGLHLDAHRRYVFFVVRLSPGGPWISGACFGTVPVTSARLARLDRLLGPATPPRPPPSRRPHAGWRDQRELTRNRRVDDGALCGG